MFGINSSILYEILGLSDGSDLISPHHPDYENLIQSRVDTKDWQAGIFHKCHATFSKRRIILRTQYCYCWEYKCIFDVLRHHPNYIMDFRVDHHTCEDPSGEVHFSVPAEHKAEVAKIVSYN